MITDRDINFGLRDQNENRNIGIDDFIILNVHGLATKQNNFQFVEKVSTTNALDVLLQCL